MNAKWCVSTLLIILALIGLSQEQTKASNQQILLQFTDAEVTSETAHDEILANIAKKLQALGVNSIEVIENDEAELSIRYYSDIDVLSITKFLSDENRFPLDFPNEEIPENYNLVVSDLQQKVEGGLYFNGKFAFVLKQDTNRLSSPVVLKFYNTLVFKQDAIVDVAYKINRTIVIAIDNTSQPIPEVRAGPFFFGIS